MHAELFGVPLPLPLEVALNARAKVMVGGCSGYPYPNQLTLEKARRSGPSHGMTNSHVQQFGVSAGVANGAPTGVLKRTLYSTACVEPMTDARCTSPATS